MSYRAAVLKVMIASPTDVHEECSIAREVIYEWNTVNSERDKVVLLPVGWETHATPALGDRPQELVNRQVLRGCDLLVAIFWTRIGTSTGVAESGTVEEITEHLAANKPAMLYFSTAQTAPLSIDQHQFRELSRFKESIRQRGLVQDYATPSDFRDTFRRQLTQTIHDRFSEIGHHSEELASSSAADVSERSTLSDEAVRLLRAAASDGSVRAIRTLAGMFVQAGGESFCEPGNSRSEARYRRIIRELTDLGYLEDQTGKGEILYVTD